MVRLTGDTQRALCRALGGEVALDLRDGLPLLAVRRPSELRLPLRADPALSEAFAAYVAEEVAFAMAHGRLPPVAEGFRLAHGLDAEVPAAAQTAAALVVDLPGVERTLLEPEYGAVVTRLEPVAWGDVGTLYRAEAEHVVGTHGAALTGTQLGDAADIGPAALRPALRETLAAMAAGAADEDVDAFARFLVAQSAITALADAGWKLEAPPGLPVTATDGKHRLTPSTEIGPDWRARCDAAGVAGVRLGGS